MSNMEDRWRRVRLRVWGEAACFTRPEMKVERVSYDVITPSAARGVLEAILWKPAIRWRIERIDVLRPIRFGRVEQDEQSWDRRRGLAGDQPIRFTSVRRNEVGCIFTSKTGFFIEDNRQQRAGMILRDVAYLIHAEFQLTDRAGPEDSVQKFSEMFRRRAGRGQCHHRPYLGCREFEAHFDLIDFDQPLPEPIPDSRDLGWMFHDYDYANGRRPLFFRAEMVKGTIAVPPLDSEEVRS